MTDRQSLEAREACESISLWKVGLLKRDELSPSQAAALWKAELLNAEDIGQIARSWMDSGQDGGSRELAAIALNPPASLHALGASFEMALAEMGVSIPSPIESVLTTLEIYLRAMVELRLAPMVAMSAIDALYNRRGDATLFHPGRRTTESQNYLGEALGLEHLYTWYRELQDAECGSILFYYNDLPREQQVAKFREELISEARILHRHLCNTHPELCAGAQA